MTEVKKKAAPRKKKQTEVSEKPVIPKVEECEYRNTINGKVFTSRGIMQIEDKLVLICEEGDANKSLEKV